MKEYDALLIATGVEPIVPMLPGIAGKENIHYLRNIQDHKAIVKQLPSVKKLVENWFLIEGCFRN